MQFAVGTINVKSNPLMRQAWVVADIARAAAAFAVILGEEIAPPRYKKAWRAVMRRFGRTPANQRTETPIGFDPRLFTEQDRGVIVVHRGIRKFTPARKLFWVRALGIDGLAYTFVSMHCVNWAFKRGASRLRLRRRLFNRYWAAAVGFFGSEHAAGRNVVGGGDLNRTRAQGFGLFHPDAVRVADHGYDHIQVLAAPGHHVAIHGTQTTVGHGKGLHTDHAMIGRTVEIVRDAA